MLFRMPSSAYSGHLAANGSRENIRSWLYRVAHNQARNRQTSYDRRFAAPLDGEIETMLDERTPERADSLRRKNFGELASAIGLALGARARMPASARRGHYGIGESPRSWGFRPPQ